MTSYLSAVGTAIPPFSYSAEQVRHAGLTWLRDNAAAAALFERFLSSSKAQRRNFCMPIEDVTAQRTISARAAVFEEIGPQLGVQAALSALKDAHREPCDIGAVVFTSCSVPAIPSIDGTIVQHLGLSPTVTRVPVYQYGCAGGVAGLALASKLAALHGPTLLISVELCSLVFQNDNHSGGHLVGAAIFADGASAAVVEPQAPLSSSTPTLMIVDTTSHLIPDTRHLMGYDLLDDGWHLRLDRDLPAALEHVSPGILTSFCERAFGCLPSEIDWWLFHPGGLKILTFLENLVDAAHGKAHWAREVLSEIGNISSSSVLFVTDTFLNSAPIKDGDTVVMMGIGPGLSIELVAFKAHTS